MQVNEINNCEPKFPFHRKIWVKYETGKIGKKKNPTGVTGV